MHHDCHKEGKTMPPISSESELGPYSILHLLPELGKDSLVEAWLAELPEKQLEVTLNILRIPHQDVSEEEQHAYKVFKHEVDVLTRLRHPNIVRIYPLPPKVIAMQDESYLSKEDVGRESWWFWAMEHLEGGSLSARMGRGRLTLQEAAEFIYQIGSALDYVHSKSIVHLGLQPQSVFFRYSLDGLDPEVELVLANFGGAAHVDEALSGERRPELATKVYTAPERIRPRVDQRPVDHRAADVYSLGVLFYQLLAGKVPFSGSEEDMERAILAARPNPLLRFDVPSEVESLILQAMQKNPVDRPSTEAFLTRLDKAVPPPREVRTGAEIPAGVPAGMPGEEAVVEREGRGEEPSASFFQRLRKRLFAPSPGKPKLLVPEDGAVLDGRVIFAWDWDGELKKDQAYELRMWKEDQSHDRAGELQGEPELEIDLDTVVPELPGEENQCSWSVAVVRESPYGSLSEEAEPRSFLYGEEEIEGLPEEDEEPSSAEEGSTLKVVEEAEED
jgi:serine/threonine protein kinase